MMEKWVTVSERESKKSVLHKFVRPAKKTELNKTSLTVNILHVLSSSSSPSSAVQFAVIFCVSHFYALFLFVICIVHCLKADEPRRIDKYR